MTHPTRSLRMVSCLLSLVTGLLSTGCIERRLTIRSNPAGALVYVNDELKGPSPVSYDFQWYGWYRLTLRKEGYERVEDHKLLRAPVWFWIPFDLAMELLPVRIRDTREWSYTLQPLAALPEPTPPAVEPKAKSTPAAEPRTTQGAQHDDGS